MWKRKRTIDVDTVLAIIRATVTAMKEGGELRMPTPAFIRPQDEPVTLVPEDAEWALNGESSPDYGEEDEPED
jgi:hypothetical protein